VNSQTNEIDFCCKAEQFDIINLNAELSINQSREPKSVPIRFESSVWYSQTQIQAEFHLGSYTNKAGEQDLKRTHQVQVTVVLGGRTCTPVYHHVGGQKRNEKLYENSPGSRLAPRSHFC